MSWASAAINHRARMLRGWWSCQQTLSDSAFPSLNFPDEENLNLAASDENRASVSGQSNMENAVTVRDASIRRMRSDTTKRLTLRSARSPSSPSKAENGEAGTSLETKECLIDDPACCCEACQATDDEAPLLKGCSSPMLQRVRHDSDG